MPGPGAYASSVGAKFEKEPPIKIIRKKMMVQNRGKLASSVPSIPSNNRMLLLSDEDDESVTEEIPENADEGNESNASNAQLKVMQAERV